MNKPKTKLKEKKLIATKELNIKLELYDDGSSTITRNVINITNPFETMGILETCKANIYDQLWSKPTNTVVNTNTKFPLK